jgi:hypothetical protein
MAEDEVVVGAVSRALLGRDGFLGSGDIDPVVGELPYQLLAALAGTLIEAELRGAEQAVFVVHAFEPDALDQERIATNKEGFRRFVTALPGAGSEAIETGMPRGPLSVPGGEGIPAMPLFVGIAVTSWRASRHWRRQEAQRGHGCLRVARERLRQGFIPTRESAGHAPTGLAINRPRCLCHRKATIRQDGAGSLVMLHRDHGAGSFRLARLMKRFRGGSVLPQAVWAV